MPKCISKHRRIIKVFVVTGVASYQVPELVTIIVVSKRMLKTKPGIK